MTFTAPDTKEEVTLSSSSIRAGVMESDGTLASGSNYERSIELDAVPDDNNNNNNNNTTWSLKHKVEAVRERDQRSGFPARELGVTWQNLTVQAVSSDASIHENVLTQFNIPKLVKESRHKPPLKTILDNTHGCVKPGEMLLVLGRPGSGCTTLLNILANHRRGYSSVTGDVHYGSMTADEAQQYRGQIVMNTEEELFFPTLTVGQTMDFATRLKIPFHLPEGVTSNEELRVQNRDFLLESMGIQHTFDTKVGNEYVRGVSGGERKRVSIIECMATRGSVFCWDNSTRGLDASTALEYTKAVRAMTDVLGLASIVTLYQAGNGIYDLFDKVLVLDNGKEMYYGPMKEARPFMESLGFICSDGANVADFLTGVTVPTERAVRPGYEKTFPRNADALRAEYQKSDIYPRMVAEYDFPTKEDTKERTRLFKEGVAGEKHKQLPANSPLTTSFATQVKACVARQYQIIWGDKATFIITQVSTLIQALIAGSLFYNAPNTSGGLFMKGGALFFALLFNSLLSMAEVTNSFTGRPVLIKHKSFAYYHPAAFCIAQIAADIPVILFQVTIFSVVLYFMVGLKTTAEAFFTFWIVVVATTMCMTAMFRSIGAGFKTFDDASKASGFLVSAAIMYNGYMIQKPQMHPWFVWIFWIDPLSYAFDALMSTEFHRQLIPCVGPNLVPNGPGYTDPAHQSCAGVAGAVQGETSLTGDQYLSALSYSKSHVWRNFGIVWAWWALFVALTIIATSRWRPSAESGSSLLIPRENAKNVRVPREDEEAQSSEETAVEKDKSDSEKRDGGDNANQDLVRNTSIFTWKDLTYTVKTPSGDRVLLDKVSGWVRPGMLGALMGSSGAGKTTLLDVLAQRKTDGTIRGSIMVDGRPLPVSFQRSAGYCEQLDVHEPYATVREALEFSALLRQSRDTPRAEKLAYVDTIIDLLELHDLADTLIGRVGNGLSVEQRKRVTIGVELVSKPSILIFLDEPTSGLDGQSAFNTVRFLRKLADVGQAVLVTIHQPSAQLFSQFDTLLLLAKGGKTVYFGDIGDNARTIRDYFGRYGAPCPEEANPAEHMIDVVSGHLSKGKDWNEIWLSSPEHDAVVRELDHMIDDAASRPPGTSDDGHEFALPLWDQVKIVTQRANVSLYRNVDYINNKFALHIFSALFNGFSFWMIGDSVGDITLRLFTIFNFIFVAPGVLAQLQPLFIDRRDIFETREKKSKMYSWIAFVSGSVVSEVPYLIICAVLYFVCWYYTVGFPNDSARAGGTFFVMLMYEFVYTGIGQFIAAYAPNAVFASLVNPLIIGVLVSFCGVLVPYSQLQTFWKYWMYYLNPFNYLMGSMLVFDVWGTKVECKDQEFALFDPANGTTCGEYLAGYMQGMGASSNLINPDAVSECRVCQYRDGSDYLRTINLNEYYYGWRDAAIVVIFAFSSYALVYLLMKLRTKTSKKAE
ncbi:Putative ABC transporter-like, ATP-binding domain, AAA+ ATPase domain, CDR ABC transporter [Colletotrichum destructivum]|uniref:ABC transporter-like, ATP-binding domain, AAA+ ATPase domain, CDR ABC transporter n=1 Tax=Colletotrichum destructivum TaxID=34406 RepID=A0AAX4IHC5_9PEZI|nr:Putative ABC transporter-like, ATP-binding domain, AAA+ ATPase domain, CDR ABC transporter [Colletotrichum destructivum]